MFKKNYVVANSETLARRYIREVTNLGMIPVTVQGLFINLYNCPAFILENKIVSVIDSYEQDILMLKLAKKLSPTNYFKEALEIKGNRKLFLKTLLELKLTGFDQKSINTLKLDEEVKAKGLIESYKVFLDFTSGAFFYPDLVIELCKSIKNNKYDEILKTIKITLAPGIEFTGLEQELLTIIKEKCDVNNLTFTNNDASKDSSLGKFQKFLKERTTTISSLDKTIRPASMITSESMVYDVFQWMKDINGTNKNTIVTILNYHELAPHFYNLAKQNNYKIYPTSGIKASQFKVFEILMTKLSDYGHYSNEEFITKAKAAFTNFSDDPLDTVLKKKALSILSDLSNVLPQYENIDHQINCYELLAKDLLHVCFSVNDLELDESGLWIAPIDEINLLSFPNVAILGLENANYPMKKRLDPILKTEERLEIKQSSDLNIALQKVDRFEMLVETFCQNVSANLYFGYQSHDLTTGKLVVPSSFYNRLLEFSELDIKIENIYKLCNIKESFLEDIPQSNVFYKIDSKSVLADNLEDYRKQGFEKTPNEQDFATSDKMKLDLSASSLETFYDCPFKFYMKYNQELYPPELGGADLTQWLNSAEKGSLLHEVFEKLLRPFLEDKDYKKYIDGLSEKKIEEIYTSIINSDAYQTINPKVPKHIKDAEIREYLDHVKSFIAYEKEYAKGLFYPVLLEEPFEIAIKVSSVDFIFKGKIDRVDTDGTGNYKVIDYKTGKNYFKTAQTNLFSAPYYQTTKKYFQHGIYSIAVRDVFLKKKIKVKDVHAGYYFSSDTGNWASFIHTATDPEKTFLKFLEAYLVEVKGGQYYKNPISCKNCEYKTYCKGEQTDRAKIIDVIPQLETLKSCFTTDSEEE